MYEVLERRVSRQSGMGVFGLHGDLSAYLYRGLGLNRQLVDRRRSLVGWTHLLPHTNTRANFHSRSAVLRLAQPGLLWGLRRLRDYGSARRAHLPMHWQFTYFILLSQPL